MQAPVSVQDTVTYPPGALPGQQRIVIDGTRGAIFEYLNGAGLGNTLADNPLAGSWAASAGTDPYGNVYPQGFQVQGTIEGNSFILNSSGFFLYSGTPALGNLIGAWSSSSGVDQFGNAYPGGFFMGGSGISGAYFRIDQNGVAYFFNAAGNNIIRINPSRQAIYLYNSSGGATGNLIVSLASVAGTDPFANPVAQGLEINQGLILLYSGAPASGNLIYSVAPANGTDAVGNAYLQGSTSYTNNSGSFLATNLNFGQLNFYSASAAGGPYTQRANVQVNATGDISLFPTGNVFVNSNLSIIAATSGAQNALAVVNTTIGPGQPSIQEISAAATDRALGIMVSGDTSNRWLFTPSALKAGPGNATQDTQFYRSAAGQWASDTILQNVSGSAETWHSLGSPGAGITVNTARYRMLADGTVMIQLNVNVTTGAVNYTFPNTLPAAYQPSGSNDIRMPCSYNAPSGAAARCFVSSSTGSVQLVSLTGANLGGQYDITFVFPVI